MFWSKITTFIFVVECYTFNIDTNCPIIYEDPFKSSNLSKSSYFGYSLVLYPGTKGVPPWIFIGAPRGVNENNTSTGICFKCGIAEKCQAFDINDRSKSSSTDGDEKLDDAWIGGSMDINYKSQRIVTCAHRRIYVKYKNKRKNMDYKMQGACYWLHAQDDDAQKLLPLSDTSRDIYTHPTSGNSVYYYGQGQAGISVHMPQDRVEIVLGAPGVNEFAGTSILYRDSEDSSPIATRLRGTNSTRWRRLADPSEFSDENIANAIETRETLAYDLLGYATTSGYFYNNETLFYVSSAPRSDYKGQVLIYKFSKVKNKALSVKESKRGAQFGEYFGASLTAGDINNDGLDDLIVGAPYHEAEMYNQGKIYIFMGSKSERLQEPATNSILGPRTNGHFGTTVQYLGDINKDGFGDVAVAAPFEEDGSGVLYLYQGTDNGLNSEPSQRIVGKELHHSIRGFGISISRAVDVDSNRHLDFAVGAHSSGHVVLLRSRPVISTYQNLTPFSNLDQTATSFQLQECFGYVPEDKDYTNQIKVKRSLEIDHELRRAFLETDEQDEIKLTRDSPVCRNLTVRLADSLSDRYNPITITLSHSLVETEEIKRIVYVDHNGNHGVDRFCPKCPLYDKERSRRSQTMRIPFALGCKSSVCHAKLTLLPKVVDLKDGTFVLGSKKNLELEISVMNGGEKAYLTQILVTVPQIVTFRSTPSQCTEKNSSSVECSVDNPLDSNTQRSVLLDLDMTNVNTGIYENWLTFTVEATTSSENSGDKRKEVVVKLTREADVTITGKSEEQNYYRNISEGKSNFTQLYQVEKFGSSPLTEIRIEIDIPRGLQMADGSTISLTDVYLPLATLGYQKIRCNDTFTYSKETQISDNMEINVDDTEQKITKLRKGSIEESEFEGFQNRTFYINCTMNQVVCSKIVCTAGPLKTGDVVKIKLSMLLDTDGVIRHEESSFINYNFLDLFGKKAMILFATQGRVTVTNPSDFVQSGDRPDRVEVPSLFVGSAPPETVVLCIVVASIVAGLLLLMLLIVALVKLGFFKRTKNEELEKLKKEIEENENEKVGEDELTSLNENSKIKCIKNYVTVSQFPSISKS